MSRALMRYFRTIRRRQRRARRRDIARGESLPTIAIEVPMPAVKPARQERTFDLEAWLRTDRGRFYQTVAREIYTGAWEDLTDEQRDYIGAIADKFAAALGVGWTKRGSTVRPPLEIGPDESVEAPVGELVALSEENPRARARLERERG